MNILRTRDVKMPERGTSQSAGIDIFIPNQPDFNIKDKDGDLTQIQGPLLIKPGQSFLIPAGIKTNVPEGTALIAFNKSGVASKKGLVIGACVIDEDYQGEIHIDIKNVGSKSQTISAGDKITQLLCVPILYPEVTEVFSKEECFGEQETQRGEGGFGSTGTK